MTPHEVKDFKHGRINNLKIVVSISENNILFIGLEAIKHFLTLPLVKTNTV